MQGRLSNTECDRLHILRMKVSHELKGNSTAAVQKISSGLLIVMVHELVHPHSPHQNLRKPKCFRDL